jgi:hypothetical protein
MRALPSRLTRALGASAAASALMALSALDSSTKLRAAPVQVGQSLQEKGLAPPTQGTPLLPMPGWAAAERQCGSVKGIHPPSLF